MPLPLAKAAMLHSTPAKVTARLASFTRVSVVITACAACSMAAPRDEASWDAAPTSLPTGKGTPMTPVDADSTVLPGTPSALPTASHTARTSRSPTGPTRALALPLLATMACMPLAGSRAAASRTGAAREALTVKHPAAEQGVSL